MIYPKISIVTPNFNGAKFLEDTLVSVLSQGYPNLDYIVIDGGSTDNSVEIIRKYETHFSYWHSKKDNGLYDALNFGFAKSSGEIMGWINSDDMLHKNSLFTLAELFEVPKVEWVQGMQSWFDEKGRTFKVEHPRLTSKYDYLLKSYHNGFSPFIQQESTYWKRSLWNRAGAYISTKYRLAGDFELWMRFFKHTELFFTGSLIGGFRISGMGQLTHNTYTDYLAESDDIIDGYQLSREEIGALKFLKSKSVLDYIPVLRRKRFLKRSKILSHKTVIWDSSISGFMMR
jgi:glycosyltransferase involved in cell wall biosynthesis